MGCYIVHFKLDDHLTTLVQMFYHWATGDSWELGIKEHKKTRRKTEERQTQLNIFSLPIIYIYDVLSLSITCNNEIVLMFTIIITHFLHVGKQSKVCFYILIKQALP